MVCFRQAGFYTRLAAVRGKQGKLQNGTSDDRMPVARFFRGCYNHDCSGITPLSSYQLDVYRFVGRLGECGVSCYYSWPGSTGGQLDGWHHGSPAGDGQMAPWAQLCLACSRLSGFAC